MKHSQVKQPLDSLPAHLTELDLFWSRFNHPMDRLPHRLLSLTLSSNFDQPLDALPSGLTRLDLRQASWFNRPLDGLPESLQVLILPSAFDQRLQQLPSSLRVLQFDPSSPFNHPLPPLPDSLSVLHLCECFNQPLQQLPRGLTDLKLGDAFDHPLPLVKPEPALVLSNADQDPESPSSPATRCPASDVGSQESKAMSYPVALLSLKLGRRFNQPLSLPASLTSLSIYYGDFSQPLPVSSLPATLTYLSLPRSCNANVHAVRDRCPFLQTTFGDGWVRANTRQ